MLSAYFLWLRGSIIVIRVLTQRHTPLLFLICVLAHILIRVGLIIIAVFFEPVRMIVYEYRSNLMLTRHHGAALLDNLCV